MRVKINNARLAFPELFTPKAVNGEGEPAYSATFILEAGSAQVAELEKAIEDVATAKWGAKAQAQIQRLRKTDKLCLRDGDDKPYDGFKGKLYVSARNRTRPTVVDRDRSPLTREDGRPYGGCYVSAIVELWAQDNQYGQRVNASLVGVQFVRDGEPFGDGGISADQFDGFDDGDDDTF